MTKKHEFETTLVSFDLSNQTGVAVTRQHGAKVCAQISQFQLTDVRDLADVFLWEQKKMKEHTITEREPRDFVVPARRATDRRRLSSSWALFFFLLGGLSMSIFYLIMIYFTR